MTKPSNKKRVVTDDDIQVFHAHIAYAKAQGDRAGNVVAEFDRATQEFAGVLADIEQSQADLQVTVEELGGVVLTVDAQTVPNPSAPAYPRVKLVAQGPSRPIAPSALTAVPTPTGTALAWTVNATDATGHAVYRRLAGSSDLWDGLTIALSATANTHTDTVADGVYEYAVATRRGAIESAYATATRERYLPEGILYWDFAEGSGTIVRNRANTLQGTVSATGAAWTAAGLQFSTSAGTVTLPDSMAGGTHGFYIMLAVTAVPAAATALMSLYQRWGVSSGDVQSRYVLGAAAGSLYATAKPAGAATIATAATADAAIAINDMAPHLVEYQLTPTELRAWRDGAGTRAVGLIGLPDPTSDRSVGIGRVGAQGYTLQATVSGLVYVPLTATQPSVTPVQRNRIAAAQQARLQASRSTAYPWEGAV